jgi:SAM-dependent methyltransferase
VLPSLRCPECGQSPSADHEGAAADGEVREGTLRFDCGREFAVRGGIPELVHPEELLPSDQMFKDEYDNRAERYDADLEWQFEVFEEDKDELRRRMVDLLELREGATVLETGAGTGEDSAHILERIGAAGTLFAQDISAPMLEVAREKLAANEAHVEYLLSNASYLPFEDDLFDAAFHFGGLNGFGDLRRALEEMTRVVKPGGKVVVGDEGIAPWLRRRLFGRILIRTNKLYKHRPPLEMLPVDVREVRVQWLLGDAFYLIDYRVGSGPLPMKLDLPMPRKGDTLRSRYYGPED